MTKDNRQYGYFYQDIKFGSFTLDLNNFKPKKRIAKIKFSKSDAIGYYLIPDDWKCKIGDVVITSVSFDGLDGATPFPPYHFSDTLGGVYAGVIIDMAYEGGRLKSKSLRNPIMYISGKTIIETMRENTKRWTSR